jgi:hypothetical protein
VQSMPAPAAERRALDSKRQPPGARSRAWNKTNQNRLAVIGTLRTLRGGGFKGGMRNRAAYLYAMALKATKTPAAEILDAVFKMGNQCDPPLSPGECRRAVDQARKARRIKLSYRMIADALDVSTDEAEFLTQTLYANTRSADKRFFPAATRFGDIHPVTTRAGGELRSTKGQIRTTAILRITTAGTEVPSLREMQRKLEAGGVETSIGTLQKEYKRLGLNSPFAVRRENGRRFEQQSLPGLFATPCFTTEARPERVPTSIYALETEHLNSQ